MFGTILTVLVVWFLISIVFSLFLGRFLALSKHPLEMNGEPIECERSFSSHGDMPFVTGTAPAGD